MKFGDIKIQFRDYYLVERGVTVRSYQTVRYHMEQLIHYLKTDNVRIIKEEDIREFLIYSKREKAWSAKTVRSYLQSFRSFYNWCKIRGYVRKNPALKIEKPKLPKRLPRCLTKEQLQKVLAHTINYSWENDFEHARNIAIIYTFFFTGVRLNELLHIKFEDVDMENQEIIIKKGKGNKERIIPVHSKLKRILINYMNQRKVRNCMSKWLFTGLHSNKRLYEKNIYHIVDKIVISSGIKFTPHMLRHTFARLACDENINLFKLKEILGHTEVSTTQIYLSVSKKGLKDSVNRLELV